MPSRTVRIQPYRASDGSDAALLRLAAALAPVLDASFLPPDSAGDWIPLAEEGSPSGVGAQPDAARHVVRTRRAGGHRQGFHIRHEQGYAPHQDVQTVDRVTVEAYGLAGASLVIECTRSWYAPRYVELRAAAEDEEALQEVAARFAAACGSGNAPTVEEIPIVIANARAAASAEDWESAEMFANAVLETDPRQPEALLYLGIARGAQGDLDGAEEALLMAVQAAPDLYDAWYNLGALSMNRGDAQSAIGAYRESLRIRPGNHAVLYQLGRACEAAGDLAAALEAYQAAVDTAPNPHGYWGFRGADYGAEARQALLRLAQ